MIYLELTKEEIEALEKARTAADADYRTFKRSQAILLNHKGYSLNKIVEIIGVHYNTIYRWITKYYNHGEESLNDKPKSGAPHKLSEEEFNTIESWLEKEPRNLKAIVAQIEEEFGKVVSTETIVRGLKRRKYVYKRARASSKSRRDQREYEIKKNL